MTKYVFTYSGGDGKMPEDPAEIEQVMAAWGAWYEQLGAAVVDGGAPFGPAATVAPDGSVSDGASVQLTGYSIVDADSLGAATDMAKGCPVLANGGAVQVSEAIDM